MLKNYPVWKTVEQQRGPISWRRLELSSNFPVQRPLQQQHIAICQQPISSILHLFQSIQAYFIEPCPVRINPFTHTHKYVVALCFSFLEHIRASLDCVAYFHPAKYIQAFVYLVISQLSHFWLLQTKLLDIDNINRWHMCSFTLSSSCCTNFKLLIAIFINVQTSTFSTSCKSHPFPFPLSLPFPILLSKIFSLSFLTFTFVKTRLKSNS